MALLRAAAVLLVASVALAATDDSHAEEVSKLCSDDLGIVCPTAADSLRERVEDELLPDLRLLQFEQKMKHGLAMAAIGGQRNVIIQGRPFLEKVWNAVSTALVWVYDQLPPALKAVVDAIGNTVIAWAKAALEFIKDAWQQIVTGLKAFADMVVTAAKAIGQAIVDAAMATFEFFKKLWDCFNPTRLICVIFLPPCDCNAGSGLSVDFSKGTVTAACMGFSGFPLPHVALATPGGGFDMSGNNGKSKTKIPGTDTASASTGSAVNGYRPTAPLKGKATTAPTTSCTGELSLGFMAEAEFIPGVSATLDIPNLGASLSIEGVASATVDAYLKAEGKCSFTAERGFPAKPMLKMFCAQIACIAILFQVIADIEITGTLTGAITASVGADVRARAAISISANNAFQANADSPQFSHAQGLDISGSVTVSVRVGLGPKLTIFPLPGVPITINPMINAEVRAYGSISITGLLNNAAAGMLQESAQVVNATRGHSPDSHLALVDAHGNVELEDDAGPAPSELYGEAYARAIARDAANAFPAHAVIMEQTVCLAAGLNIYVTLNVTGIGLPDEFIAVLDTASLLAQFTQAFVDGMAKMLTLPLQIGAEVAKCVPGVGSLISSVMDTINGMISQAASTLSSILPSISAFLNVFANLKTLFTGKLWCMTAASWGDDACKAQVDCRAAGPPSAPIVDVINSGLKPLGPTGQLGYGGKIAGADLVIELGKDSTGSGVCGAGYHICNYQEVSVLAVGGGIDPKEKVWIVGSYGDSDNNRRSVWGLGTAVCPAGKLPAFNAKTGPYYAYVSCELRNQKFPIACCQNVAIYSEGNVKVSSSVVSYAGLGLDSNNEGTGVCGSGWHICDFSEITAYGAARGVNVDGWISGSFSNCSNHQLSIWNGQDSTFCSSGSYPSVSTWNGNVYYSVATCATAGATKRAVCCANKPQIQKLWLVNVTATSGAFPGSQLDGDATGKAPCASLGSTFHMCNYQEVMYFMATTGVNVGKQAWIIGSTPQPESNRRSIVSGTDSTQCQGGNYPTVYAPWLQWTGKVHCQAAAGPFPVLCCADDGFKVKDTATTTTTVTTSFTPWTTTPVPPKPASTTPSTTTMTTTTTTTTVAPATFPGSMSGTTFHNNLIADNTGKNMCGAGRHVCNYQEVLTYGVTRGVSPPSSAWITAGFSNWDGHLRSVWSGQDYTSCASGNYPAWWAQWGPYLGRIHCEGASAVKPVSCCLDVAASSDTSNMRLSGWAGSYYTLNGLLDADNSGANVCGSSWHVCNFAEVTLYGATRGVSPSGWIVGSFSNWEAHRRSIWNGQDSTFCTANRFPFTFGQWNNYYSRVHCDDGGASRNAVCCPNKASTSQTGVVQVTASAVNYNTINSQLDGDGTGHAPCASLGSAWHICNYMESSAYMAITGVDVGTQAWIVGGFPNIEYHRRSIFNGQDSTQCLAGNYPIHFGKWSVYYGNVHCVAAGNSYPVLCCADNGYKYFQQASR